MDENGLLIENLDFVESSEENSEEDEAIKNHFKPQVEVLDGNQLPVFGPEVNPNPVFGPEVNPNPAIMGDHQNIRMANYKLPVFNGTRDATMAHRAKLFLNDMDSAMIACGLTQAEGAYYAGQYMEGTAKKWITQARSWNDPNLETWELLRPMIAARFCVALTAAEKCTLFRGLNQTSGQSVDDFHDTVMETAVILATGVPRAEFWTQPLATANPDIWNNIQRWHALQCAQLFLINGFKDSIRAEVIKAVGMDSINDIMGVARRAETAEISRGAQPSAKVAEVQHPTDEVFKNEAPAAPVAAVAKPKSKGKGKGGAGRTSGASGANGPAPTGIHQCFVCDGAHFQAKCPEVLSGRKQQKTFEAYAREKGIWNTQASGSAGGSAPGALAAQVQALQAQVNAQAQGQQPQQHQGMAQVEATHYNEYMANVANFYKDQQQDF
jgi:hypothetical protein